MPSLTGAVSGSTIAALEALRDAIAADLDQCDSMRDRASLYLRLSDVLRQLEDLRPADVPEGDDVDEIAARRAARKAGPATRPSRAKRSG